MKKSFIYGVGIALLAIGLNSCGKTTKQKITNDWKIVSQEEEQESSWDQTDQDSYWKSSMTESTVSTYNSYTFMDVGGPTTYTSQHTGIVKENKIEIRKDGTWQWIQELSYDENVGGGNTQNDTYKKDLSGTWSFVGKTKGNDFKKNERVVFNILLNKSSTIQTQNQTIVNEYSDETTYLTSENTLTFTVKESKRKELQLEMESAMNHSSPANSSGTNSQTKSLKMTLKEQ